MRTVLLALFLCVPLLSPDVVAAESGDLRVEGTRFTIPDGEGNTLIGADLVGAELDLGDIGVVRVVAVEQDKTARFDEIWLHTLELRTPGSMVFTNFCAPDTTGDERVVVYPGYFDQTRRYVADTARFSLSCVSGVEAKCLRWGYLPWRRAPNSGESMVPYFESCIHMARADYCADDRPSTRDGTSIDVYDRIGVQQRTPGLAGYEFEAGWNTAGATCVAHTRIAQNLSLDELPGRCPRLDRDMLGAHCTEASAQAAGALLFDRSRITHRQ